MTITQVEMPDVLRKRLGEDGATALSEAMEAFWRAHYHELQEAAWHRVEAAIERLTEAQARSEARLDRVEAAIERLTEAQARSEARLDRVEAAIERLTEAQARTEARVEELAQAQARTEHAVEKLTASVSALRQEVGALSENVGFGLEGIARITLPGYLERHLNLKVLGPLGEELNPRLLGPEGEEEEFDLYGSGIQDNQEITIVGEVKSRIYSDDVHRFLERIERVRPALPDSFLPVLFGYNIHPRAREVAEAEGLLLVAAYQR
ncbi:MAG: hypothetical protein ACP5HM_14605 [Anaerolineae bacterium]